MIRVGSMYYYYGLDIKCVSGISWLLWNHLVSR
ncbi:hypothetical protein CsSME_00037721 [Camellia sinensis var. sinensis]